MKKIYICIICEKEFYRYRSTVRDEKKVCCSKKCYAKRQKTQLLGKQNPNWSGKYNQECECGATKDYRAKKCAICSGRGYPINGERLSDEQLKILIKECVSILDISTKCNTSRTYLSKKIKELKIDISHFCTCWSRPIPNEKIFTKNTSKRNNTIKSRLIEEKIKENKCELCGQLAIWKNKKLTIELHHLNGDATDNRIENLQFLCPNCHSQTSNHRGAKKCKKRK